MDSRIWLSMRRCGAEIAGWLLAFFRGCLCLRRLGLLWRSCSSKRSVSCWNNFTVIVSSGESLIPSNLTTSLSCRASKRRCSGVVRGNHLIIGTALERGGNSGRGNKPTYLSIELQLMSQQLSRSDWEGGDIWCWERLEVAHERSLMTKRFSPTTSACIDVPEAAGLDCWILGLERMTEQCTSIPLTIATSRTFYYQIRLTICWLLFLIICKAAISPPRSCKDWFIITLITVTTNLLLLGLVKKAWSLIDSHRCVWMYILNGSWILWFLYVIIIAAIQASRPFIFIVWKPPLDPLLQNNPSFPTP